ncbi:hypothetical protein RHXG_00046 [Rhizobium phage RR1-A]|uniref:hypothetical protein n=1 Tax=Rhizobium phage RR1-A TaxID=929833 RepID=UPI0003427FD8|nr:hypothetical protein RHXG_00046 [Rhizobium phage RR1-A]AGN34422.1 hypothetical protein RHXG_00046 [Rhizobium phage RR1-A]
MHIRRRAHEPPPKDTLAELQQELAMLKKEYLSASTSNKRDDDFAAREIALAERFRAIGAEPSYPPHFFWSL